MGTYSDSLIDCSAHGLENHGTVPFVLHQHSSLRSCHHGTGKLNPCSLESPSQEGLIGTNDDGLPHRQQGSRVGYVIAHLAGCHDADLILLNGRLLRLALLYPYIPIHGRLACSSRKE